MPYDELLKGRYSQTNQIYHLTWTTRDRLPLLVDFKLARLVINSLRKSQAENHAQSLAFVIMPDHVHWLIQLGNLSLSKLVQSVKSSTSHFARENFGLTDGLWFKGYYDQAIRVEEDIVNFARYIVMNPVRAGLVKSIREYSHWDAVWFE